MATYSINDAYIQKYKTAIEQGEPVEVEIREEATRTFRNVKAVLSWKEIPGAERITPLASHDFTPKGEDLFIKILEDLSEEEEPLCVSDAPWQWNKV